MEASELRLWNWVLVNGVPTQIQSIAQDGSGNYGYNMFFGGMPDFYNCDPIPLTPEILEAAGFEDWGSEVINEWETCHYYAVHNFIEGTSDIKVCFITSNYGDREPYSEWVFKIDNDTIYNKGIEYFHQLQNLIFALTHQELTINLHATA